MTSRKQKNTFPTQLALRYLKEIDAAVTQNEKAKNEDLVERAVKIFDPYIEGIYDGLDMYGYGSEKDATYLGDLKLLKGKLEARLEIEGIVLGEHIDKKPVKVFLSHSHDDLDYIKEIVDLFQRIGLKPENLFCSSILPYDVPLDTDIYEHLKKLMQTHELYIVFVLSKNFYNSTACLNEMGATWVLQHHYTSILLPEFNFSQIDGAVNPNKISIKLDAEEGIVKAKLGELKDNFINLLGLDNLDAVLWETYRDEFINKVNDIHTKRQNEKVEEAKSSELKLVFREGVYYTEDGTEGPFCAACFDDKGKRIHTKEINNGYGTIFNECPICKTRTVARKYQVDYSGFYRKGKMK